MALINCPECNGQVSSQAPACPHCGFPINQAVQTTAPAAVSPETTTTADPMATLPKIPPKPYHWSDRVPVAFLLFWGGMILGTMGTGTNMVDALQQGGIAAGERNAIGRLAWMMMFAGMIWFIGKNYLNYQYYRNAKRKLAEQEGAQ